MIRTSALSDKHEHQIYSISIFVSISLSLEQVLKQMKETASDVFALQCQIIILLTE